MSPVKEHPDLKNGLLRKMINLKKISIKNPDLTAS